MENEIKGLDLSELTSKYGLEPTVTNAYNLMKKENIVDRSKDFFEFLENAYAMGESGAFDQHVFFISAYSYDNDHVFGLYRDDNFFEEHLGDNTDIGDWFIQEYYNYALKHGYTPESFIEEFIKFRHEKEMKALERFKQGKVDLNDLLDKLKNNEDDINDQAKGNTK